MKNKNVYQLLAIDPGYDRIGWAVGEVKQSKFHPVAFGCIVTDKNQNLTQRYQKLTENLQKIISQYQPRVLAIETLFFSKNKTTAINVSEAKGVIIATCLAQGLEVSQLNPGQIKSAVTGNGKADKKAVEKMVLMQLPNIQKLIKNKTVLDDAIDALAVGMTQASTIKL